jgi:aspartokinase
MRLLLENQKELAPRKSPSTTPCQRFSVVERDGEQPGVAVKMFEALSDAGINIQMISTSEIRISVLIDEKDAEKAVIALHDKMMPQ